MIKNLSTAYLAGFDCATFGANTFNCDFAYFSTPGKRDDWERGKRDGEMKINHSKGEASK